MANKKWVQQDIYKAHHLCEIDLIMHEIKWNESLGTILLLKVKHSPMHISVEAWWMYVIRVIKAAASHYLRFQDQHLRPRVLFMWRSDVIQSEGGGSPGYSAAVARPCATRRPWSWCSTPCPAPHGMVGPMLACQKTKQNPWAMEVTLKKSCSPWAWAHFLSPEWHKKPSSTSFVVSMLNFLLVLDSSVA